MRQLIIGLFGFGVVGEGIYKVLSQKQQLGCHIQKIAIKQANKKRNAPKELFTTSADEILNDPEVDMVVELIDDPVAAYAIVSEAMKKGKSVVSANKKMIAENHLELIALSEKHSVSFLYEAAVCGSVPIIRNLEEYFDNDLLTYVEGIVNGSTNYILSKMKNENSNYAHALEDAQENGFAESDPSLDVEGIDAAYKISIITLHAFGKHVIADKILRKGITSLCENDFQYAKEKDLVIKLIAKSCLNEKGELSRVSVLPTFIDSSVALGSTNNEFNGVLIGSSLADEQFLYGKGAGRYPTSSAVLSDISALKYNYRYGYKKGRKSIGISADQLVKLYISFERGAAFDIGIFEDIEEHHIGKDREYIIGDIAYDHLQKSNILNDKKVSVISFN